MCDILVTDNYILYVYDFIGTTIDIIDKQTYQSKLAFNVQRDVKKLIEVSKDKVLIVLASSLQFFNLTTMELETASFEGAIDWDF